MWHPNIDKEGKVCISILHEPGGTNVLESRIIVLMIQSMEV